MGQSISNEKTSFSLSWKTTKRKKRTSYNSNTSYQQKEFTLPIYSEKSMNSSMIEKCRKSISLKRYSNQKPIPTMILPISFIDYTMEMNLEDEEESISFLRRSLLELERDRMDREHYAWQKVLYGNYISPLIEPKMILDIGTGSGIWLMEMAIEFPNSELIGIDIVYQAPMDVLPPNCTFLIMDVLLGLRFLDNTIDYIHHRHLSCIPSSYWQTYLDDCFRILSPGGWIEIMESDGLLRNVGPFGQQFNQVMMKYLKVLGIENNILGLISTFMTKSGLDQVQTFSYQVSLYLNDEEIRDLPIRDASIRKLRWKNFYHSMMLLGPTLERECCTSMEEWKELLDHLESEIDIYHSYLLHVIVIGCKP
jgi:ubiquinone/menaquinone biosynthesis C-methylase UbiE